MYQNLSHDINSMCILKLAYQQDIYTQSEGRSRWRLYLYMGRSTILSLRHIVLLVYCPSCRKQCKNWLPRISTTKHWGMSPTFIIICLQNTEVHRNRNASCGYTYREQQKTGSYTWAYLDIEAASNSTTCDTTKAVYGMGLETHSTNVLAPSWVKDKSQLHLKEKHCNGLWPSTVHRGVFYWPKAVKPGCCRTHRGHSEWLLYTKVCAILTNWK